MHTTVYKIDHQQGLTQYSVITNMEKESEKEWIYNSYMFN